MHASMTRWIKEKMRRPIRHAAPRVVFRFFYFVDCCTFLTTKKLQIESCMLLSHNFSTSAASPRPSDFFIRDLFFSFHKKSLNGKNSFREFFMHFFPSIDWLFVMPLFTRFPTKSQAALKRNNPAFDQNKQKNHLFIRIPSSGTDFSKIDSLKFP